MHTPGEVKPTELFLVTFFSVLRLKNIILTQNEPIHQSLIVLFHLKENTKPQMIMHQSPPWKI